MGKYDFFVKLINDYDKAEKELLQVTEHSRVQEIADVAKIRLARIWMGHQKNIEALKILKNLKSKTYLPLVDELRGVSAIRERRMIYHLVEKTQIGGHTPNTEFPERTMHSAHGFFGRRGPRRHLHQ